MSPVRAMLFDLDGTLLDSAPDLVAALNHVRGTEKLDPIPVDEISRHASKGAVGLLTAGMPEADQQTFQAWRQIFLDYYAENSCRQTEAYAGVEELLCAIEAAGLPWGVVTNKIESLTGPVVEAAGWTSRAACIVCGDTVSESKPHPAPVLHACEMMGVEPADTLFAGDDVRDIQAGQAAGTMTAAIHYGYGSHELTGLWAETSIPVRHPLDLLTFVT